MMVKSKAKGAKTKRFNMTFPNGPCNASCTRPAIIARWINNPSGGLAKRIKTCIKHEQWNPFTIEKEIKE